MREINSANRWQAPQVLTELNNHPGIATRRQSTSENNEVSVIILFFFRFQFDAFLFSSIHTPLGMCGSTSRPTLSSSSSSSSSIVLLLSIMIYWGYDSRKRAPFDKTSNKSNRLGDERRRRSLEMAWGRSDLFRNRKVAFRVHWMAIEL